MRKNIVYRFLLGAMLLAYASFAGTWIYTFAVFAKFSGRALSQAEQIAVRRNGAVRSFSEGAVSLLFFAICAAVCIQKKPLLEAAAGIGKSFLLLGLVCAGVYCGYYLTGGGTVFNFMEPLLSAGSIGIFVLCIRVWTDLVKRARRRAGRPEGFGNRK